MRSSRPPLGRRYWHGIGWGPSWRLPVGHSLLVVGPTQAGKTSALVIPAILSWRGPVVVTSVKNDVVDVTRSWRATCGEVQVLEPGRDAGLTWDPLEAVSSFRSAVRVARSLCLEGARHDGDFWNALATKLVAALFVQAVREGQTIYDVVMSLERRRWSCDGGGDANACEVLTSFREYEPKMLDSVVTTAEAMLLPWRFAQPTATVRATLAGAHTLYLCSARGDHATYAPLFRGALRDLLDEQQRRFDRGEALNLLLVLDEAATIASLDELDQMAATLAGLRVTLITVVQDFSQLVARWGPRAATIVNNHVTRVVLAGLADPTVGTYLPEITEVPEGKQFVPLRVRPPHTAVLVSGRRPVSTVQLRPWWRRRDLRSRGRVTTRGTDAPLSGHHTVKLLPRVNENTVHAGQ